MLYIYFYFVKKKSKSKNQENLDNIVQVQIYYKKVEIQF